MVESSPSAPDLTQPVATPADQPTPETPSATAEPQAPEQPSAETPSAESLSAEAPSPPPPEASEPVIESCEGREPTAPTAAPAPAPPAGESKKHWYVVKVQSGREESIKEAIERRVKIEGLEEYFSQIVIPVERVTEVRKNKRVVKEKKLYPGYLMVEVEYNDRILYLFRETSGVGDFVGGGLNHPPQPMKPREVERMLGPIAEGREMVAKPRIDKGDRVRVRDGIFAGMEGEVKELNQEKGTVKVELTIFGRPTSVELEFWQVEEPA